jgi:LacI family transcriptional regulator
MNLAIPERLSLAGFDDSPIAEVIWPQLTTVRQPTARMAMEAVKLLIRGGERGGHRLDFKLVVRGSTSAVSPEA